MNPLLLIHLKPQSNFKTDISEWIAIKLGLLFCFSFCSIIEEEVFIILILQMRKMVLKIMSVAPGPASKAF
jgi:hypothetical protein